MSMFVGPPILALVVNYIAFSSNSFFLAFRYRLQNKVLVFKLDIFCANAVRQSRTMQGNQRNLRKSL